jgi:hypothetical protein
VRRLLPLLPLLPLLACIDFVDLEAFDPLPALEDLDYGQVVPADSYVVWELRDVRMPSGYTVVGGAGREEKDTLPPDLLLAFDSVSVQAGFEPHCLPGDCFYYIASLGDGGVDTWTNAAGVVAFLGTIESVEGAALVARANGYRWSGTDKGRGAVRATDDGFELIVERTVSYCTPVQVNRFQVLVTSAGTLSVLREDVVSRDEGACI